MSELKLHAKLFVSAEMEALTGIRVGGSQEALDIGGVDLPVVKTPAGIPYIPGSSIKGKMRSLLERKQFDLGKLKEYREREQELSQEQRREKINELEAQGWKSVGGSFIHVCDNSNCPVCIIFGRPAENYNAQPTRLYVRDAHLKKDDFERTHLKTLQAIIKLAR